MIDPLDQDLQHLPAQDAAVYLHRYTVPSNLCSESTSGNLSRTLIDDPDSIANG